MLEQEMIRQLEEETQEYLANMKRFVMGSSLNGTWFGSIMLLYAACAARFKSKKRAVPMSYKIIRYRKRLFCELGQLFANTE